MKPTPIFKNQYLGVNAHLQSKLSESDGWYTFHHSYIVDITKTVKAAVYPMGYTANIERSLQNRGRLPYYKSVIIQSQSQKRQISVWIELVSPSNKPEGLFAEIYSKKRLRLLQKGIVFLEIDYYPEFPPILPKLPKYPNDHQSYPYTVMVSDPHPDVSLGRTWVWGFNVDTPIPTISIPLNEGDVLKFDFGVPYQKTFEEMLYGSQIDYAQLPVNFDHYREDDQARIVSRMLAVLETLQNGVNLEQSPSPVPCLPLKDALSKWKTATNN